MTAEFLMEFRLEVFHPAMKAQAGQFAFRKDESQITVGVMPLSELNLAGAQETVPTTQRDIAISRVVLAAVQSVLRQNEERKSKLE